MSKINHLKMCVSSHSAKQKAESEIDRLNTIIHNRAEDLEVADRLTAAEGFMEEIVSWSKAYPLEVFPKPDFKKAHKVLMANGISLDAISAANMRHVVDGVGKIAEQALAALKESK